METQTRYDLNTAFENWRAELAAQPNLTAEVRRELETHLRDAIAGFQQRGLNDEESFWLARKRVGQPPQLGEEFAKADPAAVWRERLFWMWLAIFLSGTLGSLASSVTILIPIKNYTAGMATQATSILLASLIPIIIAVSLARGKWLALFSKMTRLVENRLRLIIAACICVALSSSVRIAAFAIINARYNDHSSSFILQGFVSSIHPIIILLLLAWLLPLQNQKIPKHA
jgi:hypothetical protein